MSQSVQKVGIMNKIDDTIHAVIGNVIKRYI